MECGDPKGGPAFNGLQRRTPLPSGQTFRPICPMPDLAFSHWHCLPPPADRRAPFTALQRATTNSEWSLVSHPSGCIWSAVPPSAPYTHLSVLIATAGTDRLFCGGGPVRHSLGDGGRPACRRGRHLAAGSNARVSTGLANNSTFPGRGAFFRRAGRPALRQAGCPPLPQDAYKVQPAVAGSPLLNGEDTSARW